MDSNRKAVAGLVALTFIAVEETAGMRFSEHYFRINK
jgi:hypothetical protein